MIYNIVSPFQYEIQGDDYITAIKNFIKLNHNLQIQQMIFQDRQKYIMANMKYYQQNKKNKVGIDTYPLNYIPFINKNMPFNMFMKIDKNKETNDKEINDKETKDKEKELSHKVIVPMQLPSIYPNIYPNIPSPYVPVTYNVYKNKDLENNLDTIKYRIPLLPPY